jgi:hypothetical protein
MSTRQSRWRRILLACISFLAATAMTLVVATALLTYLLVSGPHLSALRALVEQLGVVFAGQQTEHIALDLRLFPEEGRLAGDATLTLRSDEDGRRFFYFLLDDGLHVDDVRVLSPQAADASVYPLAVLNVVDVGIELDAGDRVDLAFTYSGKPGRGALALSESVLHPSRIFFSVDSFWYPSDVQGFFTTDVQVTLPADLTVVHNGSNEERRHRGNLQTVRWHSARPVSGLSLVAGHYSRSTREENGIAYHAFVPRGLDIDAEVVLAHAASANRILSAKLGPSGFERVTLCVDPRFRRAFNDGAGLLGIGTRHLRRGDYGFGLIAHEVAHNWWGNTVAEKWLSPGTGGQWIVEGFAEFSSLMAIEEAYGQTALTHRLEEELFDPRRQKEIGAMSSLDNSLDETAHDTIYRKGAYAAFMLREILGDDAYFSGLAAFLTRFRHKQAEASDLRRSLEETTKRDLAQFFDDWLQSDRSLDLSLDAFNEHTLTVNNVGDATMAHEVTLWTLPTPDGEPQSSVVRVGNRIALDPGTAQVVLDPLLAWADVRRDNNRYPRKRPPLFVHAHDGELLITYGERQTWARSALTLIDASGNRRQVWDFRHGMTAPPTWNPRRTAIIASHDDGDELLPAIVRLSGADGTRRIVGRGHDPSADANGAVYAARDDQIVRFDEDGTEAVFVHRRNHTLRQPRLSPNGKMVAYTAERDARVELRLVDRTRGVDRVAAAWERDRLRYRWSNDSSRLYVIAPGSWDWELWEVPVGSAPPRRLVDGAASFGDLALSPDGKQLAFTAAPAVDYPRTRRRLYVLDPQQHDVREIDVPGADVLDIAWRSGDAIVAVAADSDQRWTAPRRRSLKQILLADDRIEEVQF